MLESFFKKILIKNETGQHKSTHTYMVEEDGNLLCQPHSSDHFATVVRSRYPQARDSIAQSLEGTNHWYLLVMEHNRVCSVLQDIPYLPFYLIKPGKATGENFALYREVRMPQKERGVTCRQQ